MADKSNRATIVALALGHGVADMYANFLPALLPIFESKFYLSKSVIGFLLFTMSASGSLFQLVFGYLGDRWSGRLFLVLGPGIAALFICFIGLSPSFPVLFILLLTGGMGVAAFHPHAASAVGAMAGEKRGFGLSVFMTAGTAGYAVGPLVAAAIISSSLIGAARMPLFSIVGIITSFMLYRYVALGGEQQRTNESVNILAMIKPHLKPLTLLCMIVVLRATVCIVFGNFMSLLMAQRGVPLTIGGGVISLFLISTAAGTLLGGYLYDKLSRKKLLVFSLLLSSPFLFALLYVHGVMLVIFLIFAGIMIGCSNPSPLAIAQELMPEGTSTASSIMMGLSWGLAGFPVWFFGRLSDFFGGDVTPAMGIAAFLPILAAVLVFPLPRTQT